METTPRNSSYFSIFFFTYFDALFLSNIQREFIHPFVAYYYNMKRLLLFQKQIVNYTYERKKRLSIYRLCQCNKNVISHLDRVLLTPETFHWVIRRKMFVFHEFIILSKQNCQQYTYAF